MTQTQSTHTPGEKGIRESVPIRSKIIFYGFLVLIVLGTVSAYIKWGAG